MLQYCSHWRHAHEHTPSREAREVWFADGVPEKTHPSLTPQEAVSPAPTPGKNTTTDATDATDVTRTAVGQALAPQETAGEKPPISGTALYDKAMTLSHDIAGILGIVGKMAKTQAHVPTEEHPEDPDVMRAFKEAMTPKEYAAAMFVLL